VDLTIAPEVTAFDPMEIAIGDTREQMNDELKSNIEGFLQLHKDEFSKYQEEHKQLNCIIES
jgi:hypothetical protein